MFAIQQGRWYIKCNECPIRIDLAPGAMPKDRLRTPSGWLNLGRDAHVCMQCASKRLAGGRMRSYPSAH